MIISSYAIPIWITVVLIASLATVIFWGSKEFFSKIFALGIFAVSLQTAGMAYFIFNADIKIEMFGFELINFLSILALSLLIYGFISLKNNRIPSKKVTLALLITLGVFFYFAFFTSEIGGSPFLIKDSSIGMTVGWTFGRFAPYFFVLNLVYYIIGFYTLYRARKIRTDKQERKNILIMNIAFFIGVISMICFNNYLPSLGIYDYVWIGPTSGIIWVSLLGYSIVKYHQMNVRLVATEVLIIAMVIIGFSNIFLADAFGMGGRIFIFIALIILGGFLIRGTLRESEQREQLKGLNLNLQKEVEQQTREIRSSYDIERKAHLELEKVDEAKNQFIMITQHHLRTPITSIKWQLESVINGTYGPAAPELKKALGDMSESVERLNHLINNLLSISALKAGIETLKKASTDMNMMIEDIVHELHKEIDRKHIDVRISPDHQPWPMISIDKDRMQEVIFILVENAVRYNIEGGNIMISGKANESIFELVIENTGVILSSEDTNKIFTELFYRSSQAQIAHPTGMGIGLSMAQAIVEAHRGSISLSSRKQGGGVKVTITLPY